MKELTQEEWDHLIAVMGVFEATLGTEAVVVYDNYDSDTVFLSVEDTEEQYKIRRSDLVGKDWTAEKAERKVW